jgi:hypothetical protein
MQNKPVNLFSKDEDLHWNNPNSFNKIIDQLTDPKKAKKWFSDITEEWFESDFEEMMNAWFNSGTYTINQSELKFKG